MKKIYVYLKDFIIELSIAKLKSFYSPFKYKKILLKSAISMV